MYESRENNLVVIESGKLKSYCLDDRLEWSVGRSSNDNKPDIGLHTATVSRKHGTFKNMDGIWFYLDNNGKNGTVYNEKRIKAGIGGIVRPVMLNDGDVFILGGNGRCVINSRTVWVMYYEKDFRDEWHMVDTGSFDTVEFISGDNNMKYEHPEKGLVVRFTDGMAVYMGSVTYCMGNIVVHG